MKAQIPAACFSDPDGHLWEGVLNPTNLPDDS
jgi:hypothetical protein